MAITLHEGSRSDRKGTEREKEEGGGGGGGGGRLTEEGAGVAAAAKARIKEEALLLAVVEVGVGWSGGRVSAGLKLGWCREREKIDWQEARKFDCRLVRTIFSFCCPSSIFTRHL